MLHEDCCNILWPISTPAAGSPGHQVVSRWRTLGTRDAWVPSWQRRRVPLSPEPQGPQHGLRPHFLSWARKSVFWGLEVMEPLPTGHSNDSLLL